MHYNYKLSILIYERVSNVQLYHNTFLRIKKASMKDLLNLFLCKLRMDIFLEELSQNTSILNYYQNLV